MSRKWKTLILSVVALLCAISAILISRASSEPGLRDAQTPTKPRSERNLRNLSLQPEALQVSRRLGARFTAAARGSCIATGNLSVGPNQQIVTIVRQQTENGESVVIELGGRMLTWSAGEAIKGSSSLTETERLLAERLVFDSPDQFVLAQLRGASYFTVARNVRPADAGDDYTGPLWTMVRIDEPQQNENSRLLSPWRIYYINAQTGLPDRIEYQLHGVDIRTDFVDWTEQRGEKTPSGIRWSSGGRIIMEYGSASISYN